MRASSLAPCPGVVLTGCPHRTGAAQPCRGPAPGQVRQYVPLPAKSDSLSPRATAASHGAITPLLGGGAGPVFGAGLGSVFWGRILAPVLGPKVVAHTVCATGSAPKTGPRFRPQKTDPIFMPMDRAGRRQRSGRGIRPRGGGGHGASAGGPFPSEAGPQTGRGAHGGVRPLLLPPSPPGELAEPGCRGGAASTLSGGSAASLGGPSQAWSEPPPRVTEAREQTVATGTLQCRRRARDCAKPEKREPPG